MTEFLTATQLDALPVGTSVIDRYRDISTKRADGLWESWETAPMPSVKVAKWQARPATAEEVAEKNRGLDRLCADLVLAQPREISDPAELDALPVGSVVRSAQDRVVRKTYQWPQPDSFGWRSSWAEAIADDGEFGTDELDDLPVAVLWVPTPAGEGDGRSTGSGGGSNSGSDSYDPATDCRRCGRTRDGEDTDLCVRCEEIVRAGIWATDPDVDASCTYGSRSQDLTEREDRP